MQKITLILTLIQLCLSNNLMAQSKYFEKSTGGWSTNQNAQKIFEKEDNTYLIIGEHKANDSYWWNGFSFFVSNIGNLTEPQIYESPYNDGMVLFGGIETENGFLLNGYMVGQNATSSNALLVQINNNGTLLDSTWTGASNSGSYTLTRTPDNGYLLGGYRLIIDNNGNFSYPYLLRLDANFNTVWDTTYQLTNFFGYYSGFTKIIPNYADSTYYLVGNIPTAWGF